MDFVKRNLLFIGVVLGTLILLIGGVILFSKSEKFSNAARVSDELLISKDSYQSNPGAPVTLVEFGDYQCPACAVYSPLIKQLLAEFEGSLNFIFRNFPLNQHANANISSYAVEAAGLQGKFWEMHNKVYASQSAWSTSTDAKSIFLGYARDLNLNMDKFEKDIESAGIKNKVQDDYNDGIALTVDSTPTFYLNGIKINVPADYNEFKKLIQKAIENAPISKGEESEAYHIHFDILAYQNGKTIDFSEPKFQESKDNQLDPNIHFHGGEGKVVHVHKGGIDLGTLFDSLKITFANEVVGYVNGVKINNFLSYVPQDLDQIVIGEGDIAAVSDKACIYSSKCPERGTPPPEECVGGLGTECKE